MSGSSCTPLRSTSLTAVRDCSVVNGVNTCAAKTVLQIAIELSSTQNTKGQAALQTRIRCCWSGHMHAWRQPYAYVCVQHSAGFRSKVCTPRSVLDNSNEMQLANTAVHSTKSVVYL